MSSGKMLPDHLRSELRQGLVILDISQKEWAEEAEVSAALISNLIGSSQQPVRDPGRVRKLAGVLTEKLEVARSKLSAADAARAEEAIRGLLVEFGLAEARNIAPAGSIVNEGASNFIVTESLGKAVRQLGNFPVTVVIRGSRFNGISTLVSALGTEALKLNFKVAHINLSQYAYDLGDIDPGERFANLMRAVIEETRYAWNISDTVARDMRGTSPEMQLRYWFKDALMNQSAKATIIFDEMEALRKVGKEGEGVVLAERIIKWIGNFRSEPVVRLTDKPSFIVAESDTLDGDPLARLAGDTIRVGNFTKEDVGLLGVKTSPLISSQDSEFLTGRVFGYFRGQRLLSHLAIETLADLLPGRINEAEVDRAIRRDSMRIGRGEEYEQYIEGLMVHSKGAEKFQALLSSPDGRSYANEYEPLVRVGLIYKEGDRLFVPPHLRDIANEMHRREAALGSGPERG